MITVTPIASGSSGNCYHITDGTTALLLDCGVSFKQIQQGTGFRAAGVSACCLTHAHSDHSKAVKDVMKAGIDIITSKGTAEALDISGHRLKTLEAMDDFSVITWRGKAFRVEHDVPDPLGFILASGNEKLLYATDTFYIRHRFQGLTHILVECNHAADILQTNVDNGIVAPSLRDRLVKSHFSLGNVKGFLMSNDLRAVKEIWLCHLSDTNSDAARFKREIQELTGKPVYIAESR